MPSRVFIKSLGKVVSRMMGCLQPCQHSGPLPCAIGYGAAAMRSGIGMAWPLRAM